MVSLGSKHSGFVQDCEERCDQSCLSAELGLSQEQMQLCQGVCFGNAHEAMFSTVCCKPYHFARTEVSKK